MNSEAKQFYKSLFILVGPIALQNLISATVNSVDIIMLGSVGQTAIAASSLAGQIVFILFMLTTGLSSGLTMLSAQYWGKRDVDSIKDIMGIALRISYCVGLVFSLAAALFPGLLMRIFTNEPSLVQAGSSYFRAVSLSYFCMSLTQIFQASLKSVERVKTVTALTIIALTLNVILNACFIYGLAFFPRLGIVGVGIATSVSRVVELFLCILIMKKNPLFRCSFSVLFRRNPLLTRDFFKFSMPAVGNEVVWGSAYAMYSVILGHLGEDIVAANSVVGVVKNLATVLCFGMAYGGAILLGKEMGGGQMSLAERNASRLVRATILSGLLGSCLMLLLRPVMPYFAELSDTAARYRDIMMYINALSVFGAATNTVLICGIFRAGGDSRFGFLADTINMWGVSVPLGFLCAFVFKLPPIWVYLVLFVDEFEKLPFVVLHYFKKGWLRDITNTFIPGSSD